ncbi:MAG: hypothetical protein L0Y35_08900 [Flammeovirgaceae bacterium]|nr:hypothetical protein [Flammeovirgaceae bacterium]
MKTPKINAKSQFLSLLFFIVATTACDVVDPDKDFVTLNVAITDKEIFVLANQTAVINLQGRVETNSSVSLSVSPSFSTQGAITDLGNGFVQYHPPFGTVNGSDTFLFSVSSNNAVVKQDSITIYIRETYNAPSGFYPADDYVYDFSGGTVEVDILSNDFLNSGDYTVSVYKPDATFPPYSGTASISNNKLVYQSSGTYNGSDKVLYQITSTANPAQTAFAVLFITAQQVCQLELMDDEFIYPADSTTTEFPLPIFDNDSLCSAINYSQVKIIMQPAQGQVQDSFNGYYYSVSDSIVSPGFADSLRYEVCVDAVCKQAKAVIRIE